MTEPKPIVYEHEQSYKGFGPAAIVHQSRLRMLSNVFAKVLPEKVDTWCDFGCSNGFIISELLKSANCFRKVQGYDYSADLIEIARRRNLPNATFDIYDLNQVGDTREQYDLVTCIETLEHVGNYESAIKNLIKHTRDGGMLLICIPNEIRLTGLAKLLVRQMVRRNPYGDFFSDKSYFRYMLDLITNGPIHEYRKPGLESHGPHLGFDYRCVEQFIKANYLETGKLQLKRRIYTFLSFNVIYVFIKE